MNPSINSLLGPLEAATRQGSWEDVEDIAREISRLARLERLKELETIQMALQATGGRNIQRKLIPSLDDTKTPPGGSQVAKTPSYASYGGQAPPVAPFIPIHQAGIQVSAAELLESLKDPVWTAKAKANGWDIEELRKTATKALPVAPFMGTMD